VKLDGLTIGRRGFDRNMNFDAFHEKLGEATLACQCEARGWFRKKQDRAAGVVISPMRG
jgi:hypothetical protein